MATSAVLNNNTISNRGSIPNSNNPSNLNITGINGGGTMGSVAPLIPGTSNTANVGITGSQDGSGLLSTLMGTTGVGSTFSSVPAGISQIPQTGVTATVNGATSTVPTTTDNTLTGQSAQQQQELNKQLVDIYGKGTGNLLDTLLSNLGSNDSTYLQSYENAMAPANAEQLSTLNTTLGNQGVSANSSAAAIADADFAKGVTSQESAVEQQLVNQDTQDEIGIATGLEGDSKAEVSYNGFYNFLSQMAGDAGAVLSGASIPQSGAASSTETLANAENAITQGNSEIDSMPLESQSVDGVLI